MSTPETPRQYKDVSGNPCSLDWLCRNEPEWAANQIRHRDTLEKELNQLKRTNAELAASEAKLRAALQPFNGIAFGARPYDFINPTIRFGDLENVAKALSTSPSEALKPWVEFVRDASSSYIFQTQARELLKSINAL